MISDLILNFKRRIFFPITECLVFMVLVNKQVSKQQTMPKIRFFFFCSLKEERGGGGKQGRDWHVNIQRAAASSGSAEDWQKPIEALLLNSVGSKSIHLWHN